MVYFQFVSSFVPNQGVFGTYHIFIPEVYWTIMTFSPVATAVNESEVYFVAVLFTL